MSTCKSADSAFLARFVKTQMFTYYLEEKYDL